MKLRSLPGIAVMTTLVAVPLVGTPAVAAPANLDKARLVQLAEQYLSDRADRLTGEAATAAGLTTVPVTSRLASRLAADTAALDNRRELLRRVNGGHDHAEVTVADARFTNATGRVTLHLTEQTKLYFARALPGAPTHEEYRLAHRFVFTKVAGAWTLDDAIPEIDKSAIPPDTQPAEMARWRNEVLNAPAGRTPSSTERPAPGTGATQAPVKGSAGTTDIGVAYDYGAMLNYANTYWDNYNSNYRSYGGEGGDCTNFISQIMYAGGWTQVGSWPDSRSDNSNWFYGDFTWTTSYSWPAAENWYWFAMHESGRTVFLDNVWKMLTTDVLQVDFDRNNNISHSMFVTGRAGSGEYADELYMTYHSNDTHNKPLSSIIAEYGDAWYYAHRT